MGVMTISVQRDSIKFKNANTGELCLHDYAKLGYLKAHQKKPHGINYPRRE